MSHAPDVLDDAERSVIGAVLLRPEVLERITLQPTSFLDPCRRLLFATIVGLEAEGKPVDALLVRDRVNGHAGAGALVAEMSACIGYVPTADNVEFYAEIVAESARERNLRGKLSALAHDERSDLAELTRKMREILERAEPMVAKPADVAAVDVTWLRVAQTQWLDVEAPPRRYLLRHPDRDGKACPPREGDGLIARGTSALQVGAGGAAKTLNLIALGVCCVTGRSWLNYFDVDRDAMDGQVALLLAEEDAEDAWRRVRTVTEWFQLDEDERRRVKAQLVICPLAHKACVLAAASSDGTALVATPEFAALRRRLDAEGPWSLIGIDPLARFAPAAESSNALATAWWTLAETLCEVPGGPAVFVEHHSSKWARRGDDVDARGATALTDTPRWSGTLKKIRGGALFGQYKANDARPMYEPLKLVYVARSGLLRVPTENEAYEDEKKAEAKGDEKEAAIVAMMPLLLARLHAAAPGSVRSREDGCALIGGNQNIKGPAWSRLKATGQIVRVEGTWRPA